MLLYQRDRDYVVKDGEVDHRRRVHRPPDVRPPLVATACTRRSRPRKASRSSTRAMTFATITFQNYFRMYTQARRHDRYGHDRGGRVPQDLQARSRRHPDAQADDPRGRCRPRLPQRRRQVQGGRRRDRGRARRRAGRSWSAPSRSRSSEQLSELLKRRGVKHEVLNAKLTRRKPPIVAQAGRLGAVTIATNMAGRGTDIMLGGNPDGWPEMLRRKG